jgi:hypothetical protein
MDGVNQRRSAEAIEAANRFEQGHLLEIPPLFYAANLAEPIWAPSHEAAAEATEVGDELGTELIVLQDHEFVKYGIVTTQSCDVNEEFAPREKPWIQVAPVYEAVGPNADAANKKLSYRLKPQFEGGPWIADLRIELPIEKGFLVGRKPIPAFTSESQQVKFSQWLARLRGRPALANIVTEVVRNELVAQRDRDRDRTKEIKKSVYSLRLSLTDSRLAPKAIGLHVIIKPGVSADDMAAVKTWIGEWWDQANRVAEHSGVKLMPTTYHDAAEADLQVIDSLIEIQNPI